MRRCLCCHVHELPVQAAAHHVMVPMWPALPGHVQGSTARQPASLGLQGVLGGGAPAAAHVWGHRGAPGRPAGNAVISWTSACRGRILNSTVK